MGGGDARGGEETRDVLEDLGSLSLDTARNNLHRLGVKGDRTRRVNETVVTDGLDVRTNGSWGLVSSDNLVRSRHPGSSSKSTCFKKSWDLIGHYTWPTFRRQTLGLKAFITSSATICGLVIGADNHLLKHEHGFREAENEIRRKARNSLALEGKIASESEIRKWREKYEKEMSQAKEKETELLGLGSESASVDQGANKEGAVLQALQSEGQLLSSLKEKKA